MADSDKPKRKTKKEQKAPAKKEKKAARPLPDMKLFGRWPAVSVETRGLKGYVNLEPRILPRSEGALRGRFHKSRAHIVERLALKLLVSGHAGKRHRLTSGPFAGKYTNVISAVENALEIIEKKESKNPLEVLVRAIDNAAVREEVISYQLGSIMAREAVVTAPQRRVDKTLRFFAQSAYRHSFGSKKSLGGALADEILAAYHNSNESYAIKEKERIEREASGAR